MLKRIVLTVLVLILAVLSAGFLLPAQFTTERSLTIDAPAAVVFDEIDRLRSHEAWSPWKQQDPTVAIVYSGPERGVGASYSWTSESSGAGRYTLTASEPPTRLAYEMTFEGIEADGEWRIQPLGADPATGPVEVAWSFRGDASSNPIGRYMGLAIDLLLGPSFERGLRNLQRIAEEKAPPRSRPVDTPPLNPQRP
jgi:hypothetical protein